MKTVKKLSESIGVSKVSLYKAINSKLKEELKTHRFKDKNNVTLVDEVGEALLMDYFSREKEETLKDISKGLNQENNDILISSKGCSNQDKTVKSIDIRSILQEQLSEKDNQIKSLLDIVSNQQKLHATHLISDNNMSQQPRESFLKKIFRKRMA